MVSSLIRIVRAAGRIRRLAPRDANQPPDLVVTQWTYESITVVTTHSGEASTGRAHLAQPAGQLPALPPPEALGAGKRALRALLRPQSRGGRVARAALFAASLVALPMVARPVQQLLLGRREAPRLPGPNVPLLPPAADH
jgi:hypothetical protein